MKRLLCLGVGVALAISILPASASEPDETSSEEMPLESAQKEEVRVEGVNPYEADLKRTDLTARTADYIKYAWWQCKVKWNKRCKGDELIEAPAGWQACKPLYRVAVQKKRASFSVRPENWYTNDPESPDRFRAYKFHIEASGSGKFYDKWGSTMRLEDVGIRLIRADANNEDRYRAGCSLPPHD